MSTSSRQGLDLDELEVHEVLSPALGSRQAATGSSHGVPRRSHDVSAGSLPGPSAFSSRPSPNVLNLGDLAAMIKGYVDDGVKVGLAGVLEGLAVPPSTGSKRKRPEPVVPMPAVQEDVDLPHVGLDDVHRDTGYPDGVFGPDVNSEPDIDESVLEDEVEPDHSYAPSRNPTQITAPASVPSNGASTSGTVEPDADLPSVSPRPPSIWTPKVKVIQ